MRALFRVVGRLLYSLRNKHPILDGTFILYRATINFKSYLKINATAVRRAQKYRPLTHCTNTAGGLSISLPTRF
jgi:hypothetical protein